MDKTEPLRTLAITVVASALAASELVKNYWFNLTGEDSIPWKSSFVVQSEMLWFFLHMMDRYAFDIGGPEVTDTLQDAIVEDAIQGLLVISFDSSHVKKGFDVKRWQTRMASEALEEFNEANLGYGACKSLGVEGHGDFTREETVLGKLAARINRLVEQEYSLKFRFLIGAIAGESLAKSELKRQVQSTCDMLH